MNFAFDADGVRGGAAVVITTLLFSLPADIRETNNHKAATRSGSKTTTRTNK